MKVHTAVFDWVLALIAEAGLVKGERIGVDASTMEANAARRNIVRRDTGEGYRGMLERLAQESGIECHQNDSVRVRSLVGLSHDRSGTDKPGFSQCLPEFGRKRDVVGEAKFCRRFLSVDSRRCDCNGE